jgi:hypothetical protein
MAAATCADRRSALLIITSPGQSLAARTALPIRDHRHRDIRRAVAVPLRWRSLTDSLTIDRARHWHGGIGARCALDGAQAMHHAWFSDPTEGACPQQFRLRSANHCLPLHLKGSLS